MRIPRHPTLIRRLLDSRLKQCLPQRPVLAASLATIRKRCGQSSCHCADGKSLHTAYHLTCKIDGKSRTVYVPLELLKDVRSWIEEHRRLKRLVKDVTQLTLALIQSHVPDRRRKRGRT